MIDFSYYHGPPYSYRVNHEARDHKFHYTEIPNIINNLLKVRLNLREEETMKADFSRLYELCSCGTHTRTYIFGSRHRRYDQHYDECRMILLPKEGNIYMTWGFSGSFHFYDDMAQEMMACLMQIYEMYHTGGLRGTPHGG